MVCALILIVAFTAADLILEASRPPADRELILSTLAQLTGTAFVAVTFLYELFCTTWRSGRTLGKRAFGLRMVFNKRSPLAPARTFVARRATSRISWLVFRGLLCPLALEAIGLVPLQLPERLVVSVVLAGITWILLMLNLTMLLLDGTARRTLHDRLTGTLVIADGRRTPHGCR